ncbi:MAG: arylamine N-acetyltransferase [Chloroflexota bacterium]|nr:arylamine N-acetyltransferase [Chloroflexota bacterium]
MLQPPLVERVLARLGLRSAPPASRAGLDALYAAWSARVPWDNVQKRITVVTGRRPLGGAEAEEFFHAFLRDGTGGTCWPSSGALHALLVACGFDARRLDGTMDPTRWPDEINHASVIVTLDGEELLVDSSMLLGRALPLRRDAPTEIADVLHPARAIPRDGLWTIRWRLQGRDREIDCVLLRDDVSADEYRERYELSRETGFSHFVTLVRNLPTGLLTLNGTKRTFRDLSGHLSESYVDDRSRVLVDEAGLSREIVSMLPPDDVDPRRAPPPRR